MKGHRVIVLLFIIIAYSVSIYSQKNDVAYYNKRWRLMGNEELILFSKGSSFILFQNFYGILAGSCYDTLLKSKETLIGKMWNVEFSDKGIIIIQKDSKRIIKWHNIKEYDKCDPFINERLNDYYAAKCYYRLNEIAQKKGIANKSEWLNRSISVAEIPYNNNYLKKLCENEYKIIADSLFNNNVKVIDSILNRNK